MSAADIPRNRWDALEGSSGYAGHFAGLIAQGADIGGEARLADALLARGSAVLDAGAGIGRVAGALLAAGHDVTAVEKDHSLVRLSRGYFPDVPVVECDILALTPERLESAGRPAAYDLVVMVGNVMVYLAEDTEVRTLRTLSGLLAPRGRMLVSFQTDGAKGGSNPYPADRFSEHVSEAGLALQHRFGTFELGPPTDDYVVAVLSSGYDPLPTDGS